MIMDWNAILDNGILSGLNPRGTWNANTNSPTLGDSGAGGSQGDYFIVNVAGTTTIDGENDWDVGDWIINNGSVWQKIDNSQTAKSLQDVYDIGQTINANVGPVALSNAVADASHTMIVDRSVGTGSAGQFTGFGGTVSVCNPNHLLELTVPDGVLGAFYLDITVDQMYGYGIYELIDLKDSGGGFYYANYVVSEEKVAETGGGVYYAYYTKHTPISGGNRQSYGYAYDMLGPLNGKIDTGFKYNSSGATILGGAALSAFHAKMNGANVDNYGYVYGFYAQMPDDKTPTNTPIYGTYMVMPGSYNGTDMAAGKFTGDGRTVQICDTTYAMKVTDNLAIVDTGGTNLTTMTMSGTDFTILNATLLGDIYVSSTVTTQISGGSNVNLALGGSAKLTVVASVIYTALSLRIGGILYPDVTSARDFGKVTEVWQSGFFENIYFYDPVGVNNTSMVMSGTDFLITNATVSGDIIVTSTGDMHLESQAWMGIDGQSGIRMYRNGSLKLSIGTATVDFRTLSTGIRFLGGVKANFHASAGTKVTTVHMNNAGAQFEIINTYAGAVSSILLQSVAHADSFITLDAKKTITYSIDGTPQLIIESTVVYPSSDNTLDLGKAVTNWYKDIYQKGRHYFSDVDHFIWISGGRLRTDATTGHSFATAGTVKIFMDAAKMYANVTSVYDMGDATHIFQKMFIEEIGIYDPVGVNNVTMVMTGTDFTLLNATLLGDMIFDTTVLYRVFINGADRLRVADTITSFYEGMDLYIYRTGNANYATISKGATDHLTIQELTGKIYLNGKTGMIFYRDSVAKITIDSNVSISPSTATYFYGGKPLQIYRDDNTNFSSITKGATDNLMIQELTGSITLDGQTALNFNVNSLTQAFVGVGFLQMGSGKQIRFGGSTIIMHNTGVDLHFTNTAALGDMIFNTTVEHSFQIGGSPIMVITSTDITFDGHLLPAVNDNDDIGENVTPLQWKTMYLSDGIYFGGTEFVGLNGANLYLSSSGGMVQVVGTALEVGCNITNDITSSYSIGDATHVFIGGHFEYINFYDDTGAENASIYRNLTTFLFNSGTGGVYDFQVAGNSVITITASLVKSEKQMEIEDDIDAALMVLDQNHATAQFIDYEGSSQADLSGNITTLTDGDITGYVKVTVGGADRWVPFVTTPT